MPMVSISLDHLISEVVELGELGDNMTDSDVDALMERIVPAFRGLCTRDQVQKTTANKVITKFRDAGRRSPPTAVFSSVVPGRPQNAADGNRANRWELPSDHKYYSTKRDSQLVEIKYYLQALSFLGAPLILHPDARTAFTWLLGHELTPGAYSDPIMLRTIDFGNFLSQPRLVTSGHLIPLDRGGYHEPRNTFLMLDRSNTLQNNLTFDEFLALISDILRRQSDIGVVPNSDYLPSNEFLEGAVGKVKH